MNLSDVVIGRRVVLNGSGDLAMDFEARRYIGHVVLVEKITKGGLVQVACEDRKLLSVPAKNLSPQPPA